jgi:hypothetical protein
MHRARSSCSSNAGRRMQKPSSVGPTACFQTPRNVRRGVRPGHQTCGARPVVGGGGDGGGGAVTVSIGRRRRVRTMGLSRIGVVAAYCFEEQHSSANYLSPCCAVHLFPLGRLLVSSGTDAAASCRVQCLSISVRSGGALHAASAVAAAAAAFLPPSLSVSLSRSEAGVHASFSALTLLISSDAFSRR